MKIESIGQAESPIDSSASEGNAFDIVVRDLTGQDLDRLRKNVPVVREHGLVNYFDEQRFGNLRHEQGWIMRELLAGDIEGGLRTLLAAPSPHDDSELKAFKTGLRESWGDWAACGDLAGRFGRHHSLFRHLRREPDNFAEAFRFIATRIRLIHLYAFQSHLWNRAVTEGVRGVTASEERILSSTSEGPLVQPVDPVRVTEAFGATFRLPGPKLEDVESEAQRRLFEQVLTGMELAPQDLALEGIPGFQLIGEDRPLVVVPRHLRVRPPIADPLNRGARMAELRFEMPRGAYATLVVQRLLGGLDEASEGERVRPSSSGPRELEGSARPYSNRGDAEPQHASSDRYRQSSSDRRDGGQYQSRGRRSHRGGYRGNDRGGNRAGGQRDDRGGYGGNDRGGYRSGGQRDDRGGYRGNDRGWQPGRRTTRRPRQRSRWISRRWTA